MEERKEGIPGFRVNWVYGDAFNQSTEYKRRRIRLWRNVTEFEWRYKCGIYFLWDIKTKISGRQLTEFMGKLWVQGRDLGNGYTHGSCSYEPEGDHEYKLDYLQLKEKKMNDSGLNMTIFIFFTLKLRFIHSRPCMAALIHRIPNNVVFQFIWPCNIITPEFIAIKHIYYAQVVRWGIWVGHSGDDVFTPA